MKPASKNACLGVHKVNRALPADDVATAVAASRAYVRVSFIWHDFPSLGEDDAGVSTARSLMVQYVQSKKDAI